MRLNQEHVRTRSRWQRRCGPAWRRSALIVMLSPITTWAGQVLQTSSPDPLSNTDQATSSEASRIADILTKLERRSDGLRNIRCQVRFTEDDRINLSKGIKLGTILVSMAESNSKFLIHFEKSERDSIRGKQEWYLFDGRWLYEAIERIKQVTKREVAREGETIDLFDLEHTPFPLPFGHKKDTILRNFNVTLTPAQASDPPQTDHLTCIPKPNGTFFGKYDKLEFFVRRDIHLPSKIIVTKNKGLEIQTAEFPDLSESSLNVSLRSNAFAAPAAWKNFKVVVEPLIPGE